MPFTMQQNSNTQENLKSHGERFIKRWLSFMNTPEVNPHLFTTLGITEPGGGINEAQEETESAG